MRLQASITCALSAAYEMRTQSGVRSMIIQFTVVPPPTLVPCITQEGD